MVRLISARARIGLGVGAALLPLFSISRGSAAQQFNFKLDHPLAPSDAVQTAGLKGLAGVLATARSVAADVVLLAGDTFDNHRVTDTVLRQAAALIATAGMRVVLLPGNHDPAMADCLFRRAGLVGLPKVHILGITDPDAVMLCEQALEIRGRAHRNHDDMLPFHPPRPRHLRWLVVTAHGHYVPAGEREREAHRAWKFDDADIGATAADYVALGHWDRAVRVGEGSVPAYYSGSPDLAGTVNVIRLGVDGRVASHREDILWVYR